MAYETGTQGATFDFPNPYRIENQFLALRAPVQPGARFCQACGSAIDLR